jgi:type II secretory pathway component PulF
MIFSPRIQLKPLAQLCRRLATATRAGLDDRRIWRDEAQRGGPAQRAALGEVRDSLAQGQSIADALLHTGDYLPAMFQQVVAIGEASGSLDRAYRRLAEHYEHMLAARRSLLAALSWPAIQLAIAVGVVGLTIWITGALGLKTLEGEPLDIFGLGLSGERGLAIYVALVVLAALGLLLVVEAARRGMLWTRRLERAVLRLPAIGGALTTLGLARFTWALELVLDTAMDLRKALPLALDASGNDLLRSLGPQVARRIGHGATIHESLAETDAFPVELLDAIAVGEQSGMLQETMERQAKEYQERSAAAISVLAQFFGYIVWALVAALIIVLIFRVANMYLDPIRKMSDPNFRL